MFQIPRKPVNFLIFFLLLGSSAFAQRKILSGVVKDQHSEEPIPFASVYFVNSTVGKLTDSAGLFYFNLAQWPSDSLEITNVGYQPFRFHLDKSKDTIHLDVWMERGTFNEGVSVRVKVNKGLLLWSRIVKHKPDNDKFRFDNFSYELYNKLELDIKNVNFKKLTGIRPMRPVAELIRNNIDTTEDRPYLPAYLTEVLSDYYYQKKPLRRREVIKAGSTAGVKNESVLKQLGGMDQNVNVYNNFIPVMDRQFVSPLSDNGDAWYQYRVVDTQFFNNHKFFHLVFVPKRRGENTFEGDCWVNDTTYAIQKMNLRLGKDANVNFIETISLIQEYQLINDSNWFLSKDKFVADFLPMGKEQPGFIGRKTTTYRNIIVNDSSVVKELNKNRKLEEIILLPGAYEKEKEYWTGARHEELSVNERAIIKMVDTLTKAPEFKRFTNTINFIGTGYLNTGNFQLGPWFYWLSYDRWEGYRVRFDVGTNKKFNKKIWLHTYLAYGFDDKKFKGMGEIFYLTKKQPRQYLYASYRKDLDFNQNYYSEITTDNIFAIAVRKKDIPVKYIKVGEGRFEFFQETHSGFSALAAVSHKDYEPLLNLPPKDSFPTTEGKPMNTFEVSLRLRFAYLERHLENNFFRTSLGSPYPIPTFTLTKGISGVLNSAYDYTKVMMSVHDYIKVPPFGKIEYLVYAGKTFGTLPYTMLDMAPGNEYYYYNKYAYDMMARFDYLHDKYAGINFEHNIGNGIFRLLPKLKFRQFYTVKTLWGSLTEANKQLNLNEGHRFQTLDGKTYLELGTGIDNIFHVIRLDFIWRVLPASLPKEAGKKFAVFGSFRLSF